MTDAATQAPAFEGWAIIEIMGHRRLAGMVREVDVFGTKMLRIDTVELPAREEREVSYPAQASITQLYSGSSLFSLTPATREACEEVARAQQRPEYRNLSLPAKDDDDRDDDDDGDEY